MGAGLRAAQDDYTMTTMTKTSVADAKARFTEYVRASEHGEKVLILRHGRPVAALISVEDLARLEQLGPSERGGLASLAGTFEGGEELAARAEEVQRGRTASRVITPAGRHKTRRK